MRKAFAILSEISEMLNLTKIHQSSIQSHFLRVPHLCPSLDAVDMDQHPTVPTLSSVLSSVKEMSSSPEFRWESYGQGSSSSSSGVAAAPLLNVAVSAVWSFGVVKNSDFPTPQVLVLVYCILRRYIEFYIVTVIIRLLWLNMLHCNVQ